MLFIYKDYPLAEIHPWATHAAVNANCLAAQNNDAYWDFVDYLHANQQVVNGQQGHDAQSAFLDSSAVLQGQQHSLTRVKLAACIKTQDETAIKASIQEGDTVGVSCNPDPLRERRRDGRRAADRRDACRARPRTAAGRSSASRAS